MCYIKTIKDWKTISKKTHGSLFAMKQNEMYSLSC